MATLPTVPSFTTGDTSITKLQQLSDAVAFLSDADIRPMFHITKNSTFTPSLTTWQTLSGGTLIYDNDGFLSGGVSFAPTIRTQGYYAFEGCVPFTTSALMHVKVSMLFTAGASNPGFVAGTTIRFGMRDSNTNATAGNDTAFCVADDCPAALYPGDTVALQVWTDTAVSTGFNNNISYISGRLVPSFTGYWIRTAP